MGGDRKLEHGSEVAPIFQSQINKYPPRADGIMELGSDLDMSDSSHSHKASPLTRKDLENLLQYIRLSIAAEFTKHLPSIKEQTSHEVHETLKTRSNNIRVSTVCVDRDLFIQ
ncbi:Hypothetical predicted protein, partial [Pelobates cultripes]